MSAGHVILELQELRERVETLHMKGSLVHPAVLHEVEVLLTSVEGLRGTLSAGLKAQGKVSGGGSRATTTDRRGPPPPDNKWRNRDDVSSSSALYTEEEDYFTTETSSYYDDRAPYDDDDYDYDSRTEDSHFRDDDRRSFRGRGDSGYFRPRAHDDERRHGDDWSSSRRRSDRRGDRYDDRSYYSSEEEDRREQRNRGRSPRGRSPPHTAARSGRDVSSSSRHRGKASSSHQGNLDNDTTTETLQDVASFYKLSPDRIREFNPQLSHLRDDDPLPEGTRVSIRPAFTTESKTPPPPRSNTSTPPPREEENHHETTRREVVSQTKERTTSVVEPDRSLDSGRKPRTPPRTPPPQQHHRDPNTSPPPHDQQQTSSTVVKSDDGGIPPSPPASSISRSRGAPGGDHDSIRSIADATGTTPSALVRANKCLQGYHFHEPLPPNLELNIPPPATGATNHQSQQQHNNHSSLLLTPPRERSGGPSVDYKAGGSERKRTPNGVKKLADIREMRIKPGTTLRDLEIRHSCSADLIRDLNRRDIAHFPIDDELPVGLLVALPYTETKQ